MTAATLVSRFARPDALAAVAGFLGRQRWFAGRSRTETGLEVVDVVPLRDDAELAVWLVIVGIGYADGGTETYQLPLCRRPVGRAAVTADGDPRLVILGVEGDEPVAIYDALADADAVDVLLAAMAHGSRVRGAAGEVVFEDHGMAGVAPVGTAAVRPLGREQSNSSVVRGDLELLKVQRRLAAGVSPELEMTRALSAVGFSSVPRPLGSAVYHPDRGEPQLLAILQPFLHNGSDGWALALTSLRVHYADAEEMTTPGSDQRTAAATAGATFAPEAARIGEVTAQMHLALLRDDLPEALRPRPVDRAGLAGWVSAMEADLDALLAQDDQSLEPLRRRRGRIGALYAAAAGLDEVGPAIRVHGDYHLGQLLRTDEGWTVLDFEGEPDRSIAERRRPQSPLVDVAGILRSFDYAAAAALAERAAPGSPEFERLIDSGEAWAQANREAFWAAYTARTLGSDLLPPPEATAVLRRAFELRKAVYEVAYELGHRPDWVTIPLRFLVQTAEAS